MKIVNLLKYQLRTYFKGSRFVMPFVISVFALYTIYSIKPQEIVSSFLLSGVIVFLVMVWIGMTAAQNEKIVEEQILFLRMKSGFQYYFGKVLFLFIMAILIDIIYTFFPVIQNALNGFDFFIEKLEIYQITNIFILQLGLALLGGTVGNLLHPRVLKDRKTAIVLTILISVIGLSAPAMIRRWKILKWILWIFPPVMLPSKIYGDETVFAMKDTLLIFCLMLLYAIVYAGIKGMICSKHKF